MYILSFKTGHDPAACLLKDGKLLSAVEEERLNRVKHAADFFPAQAIRYCLRHAGITMEDVDHFVFAREKNLRTALQVAGYALSHPPGNAVEARYLWTLLKVQAKGLLAAALDRAPYQRLFEIVGGRSRPVASYDHHRCHAASAWFGSGYDEAAILTMDGKGETTSIGLWHGRDGRLTCLRRYGIFHSLGYLYGSVTDFLGFRINDGEYKVMGLAPYGKPTANLDDLIAVDASGVSVNTRYSLYPFSLGPLRERFPDLSTEYDEFKPPEANAEIAATLQDRLEKAALWYVKELLSLTPGTRRVCLAGGVALNVKMNRVIWESGLVEKLWIQPASGDMGNVLGAAWLKHFEVTGQKPEPMSHLYLGPGYTEAEARGALEKSGLKFEKKEDIAEAVAELLAAGKIVAWHQGRCEFGPRALGARSVLAHPGRAETKDDINIKIKFREPYRPFCPSFLEGHGDALFEKYTTSPYMVMTFKATQDWAPRIPAVVHVDGTVRPQEVFEATHPVYARLIRAFHRRTGIPIILNTSLNVKGEPIVDTPEQAVNFYNKTSVDALAVGDFLVVR